MAKFAVPSRMRVWGSCEGPSKSPPTTVALTKFTLPPSFCAPLRTWSTAHLTATGLSAPPIAAAVVAIEDEVEHKSHGIKWPLPNRRWRPPSPQVFCTNSHGTLGLFKSHLQHWWPRACTCCLRTACLSRPLLLLPRCRVRPPALALSPSPSCVVVVSRRCSGRPGTPLPPRRGGRRW